MKEAFDPRPSSDSVHGDWPHLNGAPLDDLDRDAERALRNFSVPEEGNRRDFRHPGSGPGRFASAYFLIKTRTRRASACFRPRERRELPSYFNALRLGRR